MARARTVRVRWQHHNDELCLAQAQHGSLGWKGDEDIPRLGIPRDWSGQASCTWQHTPTETSPACDDGSDIGVNACCSAPEWQGPCAAGGVESMMGQQVVGRIEWPTLLVDGGEHASASGAPNTFGGDVRGAGRDERQPDKSARADAGDYASTSGAPGVFGSDVCRGGGVCVASWQRSR